MERKESVNRRMGEAEKIRNLGFWIADLRGAKARTDDQTP